MMCVAFHFDLVLINNKIFALNVTVVNGFGFYTFLPAAPRAGSMTTKGGSCCSCSSGDKNEN